MDLRCDAAEAQTREPCGKQRGRADVEQVGEIFDVPVTVTVEYADRKSVEVLIPVTERIVEKRVPLAGVFRGIEFNKDEATLAEVVKGS